MVADPEASRAEPPADRLSVDGGSLVRSGKPRPWGVIGVALVGIGAMVGANLFGIRDRLTGTKPPVLRPVAVSRGTPQAPIPSVTSVPEESLLRSYPWWQDLAMAQGTAPPSPQLGFTISPDALQWRVIWSCTSGRLTVQPSSARTPIVDAPCPASGTAYGSGSGPTTLAIAPGSEWRLNVAQQVDVPLVEPPTVAMASPGSEVVASGTLYGVDQSGSGRAIFYRQTDGKFALRLEHFFITPNVDLEIRLSPIASIHSTAQYLSMPSVPVAPLDVTTGSINFPVPGSVNPLQFASIAIWCPTITSLYAAAVLTRP